MTLLDSIKDGFAVISRGLHRLQANVALTEAKKNLRLAEEGYVDAGRILLRISPEEQAEAIERATRDLETVERDYPELGR